MATFDKHKEAADEFQTKMAESGLKALKKLGESLQDVGKKLANGQEKEDPAHVLADAILGAGRAHAQLRDGAIEAATAALKKVRK